MKYARDADTGELLTIEQFYQREGKSERQDIGPNGKRGWMTNAVCPDCGGKVHPNDSKAAKGIRIAAVEVAEPQKGNFSGVARQATADRRTKLPGFDHHDHEAAPNCPSNYAHDKRYAHVMKGRTFDSREVKRNHAVLSDPAIQAATTRVFEVFMQRLTGDRKLSEQDSAHFVKWQKRLEPMVGLAENWWALPYMAALLIGQRERKFERSFGPAKMTFRSEGEQIIQCKSIDGAPFNLVLPKEIQPCFVKKKGRLKQMINPSTREGVSFPVSAEYVFRVGRYSPPGPLEAAADTPAARPLAIPVAATSTPVLAPAAPDSKTVSPGGIQLALNFGGGGV